MLSIIATVLTVLAFALAIARPLAPVLVRLMDRPDVPPWRWAWAPPAAVLFLSLLAEGLARVYGSTPVLNPEAQVALDALRVVVDAAVAAILAYQRGHGPTAAPAQRPPLDRIGPAALLVLLVAVGLSGCAPSLGSSLAARAPDRAAATPEQARRCRRLDRTESTLRWVSRGAAVLAGGTGLSTIPVDDPEAQAALAVSGAVAGVGAAAAEAVRSEVAADFLAECGP